MVLLITKFLVRPRRTRSGNKKNKSNNQKDGKKGDGQKKKQGEGKKSVGYSSQNKNTRCYLCNGLHRAKDCPKKEKVSALLIAQVDNDGDADSSEGPSRMNPLQLLNAITMEKQAQFKGLLHVKVRVNGQVVNAMMDCSATNNFMSQHKAGKLGLTVAKNSSKLKAMKSEVRRIQGSAAASLVVGSWEGVIARLDDFDLILGAELLVKAKVSIMPPLRWNFHW